MQGPEVRSGDLSEPAVLIPGEEWIFTIKEGETGAGRRISVNYDGFCDDVSEGDVLLVDGGIMTFQINSITDTDVVCEVCSSLALLSCLCFRLQCFSSLRAGEVTAVHVTVGWNSAMLLDAT